MNDQPTTSGSRWEPTQPTDSTEPARSVGPADPPAPAATPPVYVSTVKSTMSGRSRAIIAGAAVGLLGVGGLGGYAIGAATAGDETSVVDVDNPFGRGGDGDGDRDDDVGGRPPGLDQGQLPPAPDQDDDDTQSSEPGSNT